MDLQLKPYCNNKTARYPFKQLICNKHFLGIPKIIIKG